VGWFGFEHQKLSLNGSDRKKLQAGLASLGLARMKVRVSQMIDVTYGEWVWWCRKIFAGDSVLG